MRTFLLTINRDMHSEKILALIALAVWTIGLGGLFSTVPAMGQDPFAANIRPTDPLTPDEERLALQVPPGFEVQLVAAEPDIQKPMNMAFDARGRLWITDTREYPLPVSVDEVGRDTIKILEDRDGDGRAEAITTFADGLNIPIGLYPVGDGCVVFSIPHIWWLEDTDGDNVADKRIRLYGPLGFDRDTHGLNNSFRRGYDGWLYACHGFNNHTQIAGSDGHEISMQSGNTYRVKLDGSRVEHFTWGQVNPFGMTFDRWGNLFTSDCHSKPIYQLLRGGYYPSFGKPHDGLGFVTPMMDHLHGSTAIAGLANYDDMRFPDEYRQNFYSGNVMTSRVNRDSVVYHGSTPTAIEEEDFVVSRDPWFRPVDVQLGPDGALYVADFYNRIIGHYEVDLHHPGRDRTSGRLWRIVYRDASGELTSPPLASCDLSLLNLEDQIKALADGNLTRRLLALNWIVDETAATSKEVVIEALQRACDQPIDAQQKALALWGLARLNAPLENRIVNSLDDRESIVRVHAARILVEQEHWSAAIRTAMIDKLDDDDPLVRRVAAEGLATHPAESSLMSVVQHLSQRKDASEADDPHEIYMLSRALKHHLQLDESYQALSDIQSKLTPAELDAVDAVSLAVASPASASYLLQRMESNQLSEELDPVAASEHMARFSRPNDVSRLVQTARQRFAENRPVQVSLIDSIREALATKQAEEPAALLQWGAELSLAIWANSESRIADWSNLPMIGKARRDNPWTVTQRRSSDQNTNAWFLDSLPSGEPATGTLRSKAFEIPGELEFYCAGHIGHPNEPLNAQNFVRLIDAQTGRVLMEARPPRNDVAQRYEWKLDEWAGRQGQLEIVDGDERDAYAWLAVGRFSPAIVEVPPEAPRDHVEWLQSSLSLIRWDAMRAPDAKLLEDSLKKWLLSPSVDPVLRSAIARILIEYQGDRRKHAFAVVIDEPSTSMQQREQLAKAIVVSDDQSFETAMQEVFPALSTPGQRMLLRALATSSEGRATLYDLVQSDRIAAVLWNDVALQESIRASQDAKLLEALKNRLASAPPKAEARQQIIDDRARFIGRNPGNSMAGTELFQQHCAKCHRVGDRGEEVGPQLDGIGQRGMLRVVEDVLDPNRHVDAAFRSSTVLTLDGQVLVGLFRRADGAALVFVDREGKEFRIDQDDVEEQQVSSSSLMPDDVALELPPERFADLIAYLMEQRQAAEPASPERTRDE